MADNQPAKAKRRVKNPETFRERAIKAAEGSEKPKRLTRAKQRTGKAVSPVFKPIGKAGKKVGGLKPVRWLRKPLSFIGKILLPVYVRNSWKELRKVTWPSWKQARELTVAVMLFAAVFGVVIFVIDFGLDKLFRNILLK